MTYNVRAVRWERGWELHIEGVGVTQSHGLKDAEAMIRDYLEIMGENATAEVKVAIDLNGLEREAEQVRQEVADLKAQQERVAAHSRAVARKLKNAGLHGADAAEVMQVSPQRFSQLVNA